ncbi:hypothetical protein IMCC9480_799 [Oxalobacteraceae bacterium IMCC9480]|nr:hypothetical protein IMCC9480_799 [Oxalobacteraceae bacterium IMCC9480]
MIGAQARFDGGRHRHDIAVAVAQRQVRGAMLSDHRCSQRHRTEVTGGGRQRDRRARADQARTLRHVRLVDHAVPAAARQRDEVGVGDVLVAIGIGQVAGFGHQVHAQHAGFAAIDIERAGPVARHVEVLDDAEDLRDGDAARRRWRHAADFEVAIGRTDRRAFFGAVIGHVGQRRDTGRGGAVIRAGDFRDDGAGDRTVTVKRVGTFAGNAAEGRGQCRIPDEGVDLAGAAISIEEIRRHLGVALDVGDGAGAADRCGHTRRNREAIGGQFDGRVEQVFPGQSAMFVMGHFEYAQSAWRTDRTAAADCRGQGRGLVGRRLPLQVIFIGRGRCHFASIVGDDLLRGGVVVQDEGTAANARRLRLDQVEHHLRRDCRIDRGAALLEHVTSGLGRGRVVGHGHVGVGLDGFFGYVAGGDFRCPGRARQDDGFAAGAAVEFAAGLF